MRLAIISVVYQNYTVLDEFLNDLKGQTDADFHLFLSDLTPKPQVIPRYKFLTTIKGENKGYAHGVNLASYKAIEQGYNHFVVINNDVTLKQDFIKNAKSSLNKNQNSLIGGKIYYAPGHEYHHCRPEEQGKIIWYAGGYIDWRHATIKHLHVDELDQGQVNVLQETEMITGCLMLYPESVLTKIGDWDEIYFMYYEDADFGQRAKKLGIKLIYDPSIEIWHKNGQSTGGSGSAQQVKWQRRSQLIFGLKYAPWKTKLHLIKNYIKPL